MVLDVVLSQHSLRLVQLLVQSTIRGFILFVVLYMYLGH